MLSGWAVAALAAAIAAAITCAVTATTATRTALTAAIAATTTTTVACVAARAFAFTHALQHLGAGVACSSLHHIAAWRLASATPNGLATHGNGLGFFTWLGHEAFNNLHRNVLLGEALNVLHEAFLIQAHQVGRCAIGASAAGAANAVHIVFADVRNFIVHHVRQVVNVNAASRNVGGYQRANVTALEATECLGTRCLAFVAVQGHGLDAVFGQKLGHVVGTKFGAGEHQHLAPVVFLNDVRQDGFLFATAHGVNHLCDALHRGVARRHLNALGVLEQGGRQVTNFIAERGREQQALLVFRHHGQYFFHVMDKAHVEHAVGLVEHQNLYLTQIKHALLQQVQ